MRRLYLLSPPSHIPSERALLSLLLVFILVEHMQDPCHCLRLRQSKHEQLSVPTCTQAHGTSALEVTAFPPCRDRYLYVDGDEYPIVVSSPGFNDHHTTVALSADANKMWIRNPDVQVVSSDSSDVLEKIVPVQAAESVKKGPIAIPSIVVAASEDLVERVKSGAQGAAILNTFVVENAKKFEHVTNGVKAGVSSVPSLVVENAKKGVDAAKELGSTVGKSAAAGIGATAKIPTLAIRNALKVVVGASKLPAAAWHSAAERVSVSAVQLKSSASGACGSVADVCCCAGQGLKGAAAGVGNAARATVRAPIGFGKMAATGVGNIARTTVRAPIGFGKMAARGLGNAARTTVRAPMVLTKRVGQMPALAIEKVGQGLNKPARAFVSGVSHLGNIVSVPGRFLTQGGLGAYGQQVGESWSRFADRFTTGIGASKRHFVQDISRACVSLQSAQHATGAVLGRWMDYMKLRGGLVVLTGLLGAAAWQQYTGIGAEEIATLTRRDVLRVEHKKKPTASWQDYRQPTRACDRASMYSGFMPDALASTALLVEKNQRGKMKRQQSSKDMGPSFSQILGGFAPTSEHDTPHKVVVNFLKMGFVLLFGDLVSFDSFVAIPVLLLS